MVRERNGLLPEAAKGFADSRVRQATATGSGFTLGALDP
jgi:hypothetical protein